MIRFTFKNFICLLYHIIFKNPSFANKKTLQQNAKDYKYLAQASQLHILSKEIFFLSIFISKKQVSLKPSEGVLQYYFLSPRFIFLIALLTVVYSRQYILLSILSYCKTLYDYFINMFYKMPGINRYYTLSAYSL